MQRAKTDELSEPDDEINTTPSLLRAVTFDEDELDPLGPEVHRAVPPQSGPHNPAGPPEQINLTGRPSRSRGAADGTTLT